jgi:aconitate hydratase
MVPEQDPFSVRDSIRSIKGPITIYNLTKLEDQGIGKVSHLPYTIKILLESLLRNLDDKVVTKESVEALANWQPDRIPKYDISFTPSRVVLQDFTGVPAVVDLAALRSAVTRLGGDPSCINPVIPADLVIDHSVQVDYFGAKDARKKNEKKEFEHNRERYALLRWAQGAFDNFRVIPPGRGIVHQVNLEYLASVVHLKEVNKGFLAYPDTLVGTDSHTTMINGLGVLGWGVGGIEAEAVVLGQPYYMPVPEVVGFKLIGELPHGITATDLVLTITQILRAHGVVGKFVEFYGPGIANLSLPDRATIANMAPEYGATVGFFPVDEETLKYLVLTGRKKESIEIVRLYLKTQGLLLTEESPEVQFSDTLEFDMSTVEPSLAGPKRPQDRISLNAMSKSFHETLNKNLSMPAEREDRIDSDKDFDKWIEEGGNFDDRHESSIEIHTGSELSEGHYDLKHGSIVIAAITSCTNTSNPSVLIGAGLLAKNAHSRGLTVKPHVKTSLAPGSRVVIEYLKASGLLQYLETIGFYLVGYGCTTCIGNSGPIPEKISKEVKEKDLTVAAVLSGNRNFEGRINSLVKANYLASPMLVVAYALAGNIDIDLIKEPLGNDANGKPVYLMDIWPSENEIGKVASNTLSPEMFNEQYENVFKGTSLWNDLSIPEGKLYEWDPNSTYIQEPPFFQNFPIEPPLMQDIKGARVLALLGDSITTDHISPAGSFSDTGPSGQYLISKGIALKDFNSYGSRRGNHEIMMRGTFANIRLRNKLVPDKEGGWSVFFPNNEIKSIYDAAMSYIENNIPLIVIAGKEYGTGSSRDWAAKGTSLLGVKAVIAESYERIHRSNLVGMGILPLQFRDVDNSETLGLKGNESYDIIGITAIIPGGELDVLARAENKKEKKFKVIVRLDSEIELEYYRNGGILHKFLRDEIKKIACSG